MVELQKGFNTLGIDIFVVLYHLYLYFFIGINEETMSQDMLLSFGNYLILRQLVAFSINNMIFNAFYSFNIVKISLEVAFYYFIQEFYMYFIHRFMHWSRIAYNWIHRLHHMKKAECFTTAMYMSPLEIILHIFPDVISGPLIVYYYYGYVYKEALFIWICVAVFYFVWSHTGIMEPMYMTSSRSHWLHHKYYTVNYGSGLFDWLLGTAKY